MSSRTLSPQQAIAHLEPAVWAEVNAQLVVKAIGELAHELLIAPAWTGSDGDWSTFVLSVATMETEYRFRARILELDHWLIERRSLEKVVRGTVVPLDAIALFIELRDQLGIAPDMLPAYLAEIAVTLYGAAYKRARGGLTADELVHAGFQAIEAAMTEGHPIFLANNGRVGFNACDYRAYAPEAGAPLQLVWLAATRERAGFACVPDWSYEALLADELGAETLASFASRLRARGLDPARYYLIPVHPWQWENRVAQLFASDLASGDLVHLGRGNDHYLAQQSIRTLFNASQPDKRYVKTSLSIRNMGFTRGISAAIAERAAAVNHWAGELVSGDAYLRQCNFTLLREIAFAGYRHRHYEKASVRRSDPYKEMLAAQWRESPMTRIAPHQRLMTMAALMHRDGNGASTLVALIRASGLAVGDWLGRYLHCYLHPLLHCFYAHKLVFSPHCENVILVLEDHVPVGVIIKDIAEDIGVLDPDGEQRAALPEPVRHLALRVPEHVMTLSIFTDVFDCVFRFLAAILEEHAGYSEVSFWRAVADSIGAYERARPELADRFARYDLFASTFIRNCLNRLQLTNHEEMVDLNAPEPVDSLQFVGTLTNPIASLKGGLHV